MSNKEPRGKSRGEGCWIILVKTKFFRRKQIVSGKRRNKFVNSKKKDGKLVRSKDARKRWREYFEHLLTVRDYREVELSCLGSGTVSSERRS